MMVGVMDKIGTFGMIRFCLGLFPEASLWATPVVLALAVISILYGAILAIGSRDIMRFIAYTSISHFGFIVLGIFAFTTQSLVGSTLYMLNHGLSTAALFLAAGYLIKRRVADINAYGGVQRTAPVLAGLMLFAGLSTLSLPGLSSFVSEFMVLAGTFSRLPGVRGGLDAGHRAGRALHPDHVPADNDRTAGAVGAADPRRHPAGAAGDGPAGVADPGARRVPEADAGRDRADHRGQHGRHRGDRPAAPGHRGRRAAEVTDPPLEIAAPVIEYGLLAPGPC